MKEKDEFGVTRSRGFLFFGKHETELFFREK
jgi:hypothetical protein